MTKIQIAPIATQSALNISAQKQLKGGNVIVPADTSGNFIIQQNGATKVQIDDKTVPGFLIIRVGNLELSFATQ